MEVTMSIYQESHEMCLNVLQRRGLCTSFWRAPQIQGGGCVRHNLYPTRRGSP